MTETWKTIADAPEYEVSSQGRVRSWKIWGRKKNDPPRILSPGPAGTNGEYRNVYLSVNKKVMSRLVQRLVLEAFIGSAPIGMEARHLNGNASDNRLENLEWATHMENMQDKVAHGTLMRNRTSGDGHKSSVLTSGQVAEIRVEYASGGVTHQQLADKYHTSRQNIGLIINNKSWKKV